MVLNFEEKEKFIETINNIDFLYGFIYEYANLVNNLDNYDNDNHLSVELCNKFIIPIINITKKEHIKEYNEHIKNKIDNLESIKDIYRICSYLMNICCEEYFKLSQDEYLKIKKFIDNSMDIIDSTFEPMSDFFDTYIKRYGHYYCTRHYLYNKKTYSFFSQIYEKIIKSYFNIWYINFFYLLQKNIKLNKNFSGVYNVNVLTNIFRNICDNSSIDCNKKNKNKIYDLHNNIIDSNRYKNGATIYA